MFTPKTRVSLRRYATEIRLNQNVLRFLLRAASATLFQKMSRGFFYLRAYCFRNGGARTTEPWSARWFRAAEPVARKI